MITPRRKESISRAVGIQPGAGAVALGPVAVPPGEAVLDPQFFRFKAEDLASAAGLQQEGGAGYS